MTSRAPHWWQRLAWLAVCGPWFFLAYGFTNWLTAQRPDVGTFYWAWERQIPFVPEFIVPYWSLDLFFAAAFFLPKSLGELHLLGKRLLTVITLSCVCFLLWPLEFGMPRPVGGGWTEPWFRLLQANDLPYNMAPSLHISLRCILWITYGRHLRGAWRAGLKCWFIAIGLSTLLVWQHHLVDVIGGFVMAYLVVALLPDGEVQAPEIPAYVESWATQRVAAPLYALGAIVCGLLASLGGAWLWWPAVALAIVAVAYGTGDRRWLQTSSGALTPAAEWILLPVLLGTWLCRSIRLRRRFALVRSGGG